MVEFHAVRLVEIQDGTSNTLLLGEHGRGPTNVGYWNWFAAWDGAVQRLSIAGVNSPYPPSLPYADRMPPAVEPPLWGPQNAVGFGSYHPGGANFALADGSVRFVKGSTDYRVLGALGTRAGGEVVSASDF
jgi:prepilin-type processing-associated H-X9-DG protein